MFTKIYQTIKNYNTIIIHRHNKPDGDALGSQLALKESLKLTYPNKDIYAVGDIYDRYSWMGNMDIIDDSIYNESLVIILDTGAEYMISDERYKLAKEIIKIDHHIPQGEYGDLLYIDTTSESCSSIIAKYILEKRYKLNSNIASLLYTGIVTDSGRFRYNSTTSNTFKICSELLKYNIDLDNIYSHLYTEHIDSVKLKAKMTSKFKVEDNIAYLINTYQDILNNNTTVQDISRGMIGLMNGIEEVYAWCSFTYDINGDIYVELRSNKYNVNKVATKYGGGGHLQASGATIKDESLIKDIINDLKLLVKGE